jgi:hypothetical protein
MALTPTQIKIYENLLQIIQEKRFPLVIEGNPGCGKTTIVKELKKQERDLSLIYINNRSFDDAKFLRESIASIGDSIDNLHFTLLLLKRILKFVSSVFFLFLMAIRRNKIMQSQLPAKVYTFLFLFDRYLKKNPNTILILDELNFWNDSYLKILYGLLFSDIYKQSFRFLGNAKIILLFSCEYHISELLATIVRNDKIEHLHMDNYTNADVECLISDPAIRKLTLENISTIRQLSLESNLSILLAVIEYLKKNKSKPRIQAIIGDIESIIDKYLNNELNIRKVLKSASIPFEQPTLDEIIQLSEKIYDFTPETTKTLILRLLLKKILQSHSDILIDNTSVVQFIHQDYREYFKPKTDEEMLKFFSSYAKVLQIISPGDYQERSESYKYALEQDKYYLFQTLYIIQTLATESEQIYCIEQNPYKIFIGKIQIAYDHFNHQRSTQALRKLEEIDNLALPSLLLFEKDFLKLKIKMVTGDKNIFEHTINVMNRYCKEFEEEKEIVVRANTLLYLAYLYLGKNTEMETANQIMIQEINKLSKNNDKFQYYLYSLYRRSLMVKTIEAAYEDTILSVNYFQKKDINNHILYRRELFYSLINHADNCRYLAKYDEAYEYICRAGRIYEEHSVGLPNITFYNNLAVIAYENSRQSAEISLAQLYRIVRHVDIYATVESTYYIIYSNIACIYAMEDRLKEALVAINKAFTIIDNVENKINNHFFNLLMNKSVILLLMKEKNEALSIVDKAKYLFTYHFSSESNRRRYNIIYEIIRSRNEFSFYKDLYHFIEDKYPPSKHLNRPLRLWNMQYWSK